MARRPIAILRVLLGVIMALLLIGQLVLVPILAWETATWAPEFAAHAVPLAVLVGAGFLGAELVVWCVWRLTALVRDDVVFSPAAFRHVDLMIRSFAGIALAATAVLLYVVVLGAGPITVPLAVLAVVVGAGAAALLVVVLRALLRQATGLKADLAEVI